MAVTISSVVETPLPGGQKMIHGLVTFDSSYPTGGETFDLSSYFLSTATSATFTVVPGGDDGYVCQHDRGTVSAGKLLLYEAGADAAALDEVGNASDMSSVICPFIAIGPAY